MTVLVGGMRALNANYNGSNVGIMTSTPGVLTNEFFVNLLDMKYKWEATSDKKELFNIIDRSNNTVKWTATRADLIFGSNTELRAVCEVYGANDGEERFVNDFAKAWAKVMNADRFDL